MIRSILILASASVFTLFGYVSYVEPLGQYASRNDSFPGNIDSNILVDTAFSETKENIEGGIQIIRNKDGDEYVRLYNIKRKPSFPACKEIRTVLSQNITNEGALDLGVFDIVSGDVNYKLPPGKATNQFLYLVLWCKSNKSSYGSALIIDKDKIKIL